MRLLVVTTRYPTPDRPAAGAFVRDRLGDPGLTAHVVAPHRYDGSRWGRFARLVWEALSTRGRFDGVEAHFVLASGPPALLAARLRGLPLVAYAHGADVRDAAQRSPVHRWLASRVVRSAAAVVTNSTDTAEHVGRLGGHAEVIPPGIDLARFGPSPRPSSRRVLYLGGDVAEKGVGVARQLADTLVGPGLREVDPAEVPGLMASHDVVLVPSRVEPYGLVAAEAIASGRWVVASAVGGLTDIVTDGVTGTLVHDGDFAEALARVPDYDPAAVAADAQRFSVERHRAGMRAIWQRVLSGRQRPARM
ncbi:MAG TPA: glycosyltransferase [Pleomorphomonadaceae bacterium]|jgi:teichuronic acid biosynthesis glycosyltransferase TuaC|nr:glycosyltransferase [Pleomorphomonadaceae bacterium]